MSVRIGTAGWSIASQYADRFPREGHSLERYAARFPCVEINSSFYRSHRAATWSRWATLVPETFRFAVKVPRTITHDKRLAGCGGLIGKLVDETAGLSEKLGIFLVQLPPTLVFHADDAETFFRALTASTSAQIVCEPRHRSWFTPAADALLARLTVMRAAADPAPVPAAADPGGWRGLSYWRLHGSPVMYRSPYDPAALDRYAARIEQEASAGKSSWCIFDNTAAMAAIGDALSLGDRLARPAKPDRDRSENQ